MENCNTPKFGYGRLNLTISATACLAMNDKLVSSAQQNTDDRVITANVGQRITVSICTLYSGAPYLRIIGPGGYLIGSNDDGCAAKGATYSFVTTSTGSYTIRAGCYAEGSCTGRVEWTVQNVQ